MDQSFPVKNRVNPRILVAPLDWGLGHATRCIPIIQELILRNCDVWLAGEGAQEKLLRSEFPALPFIELRGYRMKYSKTKKGLIWKMLMQGPKMRRAIGYEHRWLKKMMKKHEFDGVISDNRYGLHHPLIPCVFITHQLRIKSSVGKWTEKLLQKRNYQFIKKFNGCWVPDLPGKNNLAGELSHPATLPDTQVNYIGLLSRFKKTPGSVKKNYLLIVFSGPEPQRTIFEEKIIKEIVTWPGAATIVRGLPDAEKMIPSTRMIHFYNHLPAAILNNEMLEAEYVISRSGYSTVMDIVQLGKKSVLVPTPGQTEQEYLAAFLAEKKIAVAADQDSFSLASCMKLAEDFDYQFTDIPADDLLKSALDRFLLNLPGQP